MRILVLGAGGMAGHTIAAYLCETGHDVLGLVRRPLSVEPAPFSTVRGDVRDDAALAELVAQGRFDAIVNCIGILNQDADRNRAGAVYLNAYLPHHLAELTADTSTRVIHLSTDCVFSGARGGYREDDLRDGTTFYDRTKALGELEDDKNITLRQSIVGPDLSADGIGLFNWFMAQRGSIRGYTRAMWTGITTLELAKVVDAAIRNPVPGLHHMVPDHPISKHDLLQLFRQYTHRTDIEIEPWDAVAVDKSLIRTRFDFPCRVPDYDSMVADMVAWIRAHRAWYPHYTLGEE